MTLKSVRSRMLVWLLIPLVALSTFIAYTTYLSVSSSAVSMVESAAQRLVLLGSRTVTEWLNRIIDRVKVLAEKKVIAQVAIEGVEDMFICYDDGLARSTKAQEVNMVEKSYFKEIFSGKDLIISQPEPSPFTSNPCFVVAAAFKDYQGKTLGLYGATIPLETVSKLVGEIKLSEQSFPIVVSALGTVMVHPDRSKLLKLDVTKADEQLNYKGLNQIGQKMVKLESGFETFTDDKGRQHYVFFTPIKDSPGWSLGIVVPVDEILKDARRMSSLVAILFVVLVAVISLIVYVVANSVAGPIKQLAAQVGEFGKGDLSVSFKTKSRDETSQIAQALEQMAQTLKDVVRRILSVSDEIDKSSKDFQQDASVLSSSSQKLGEQMKDIIQAVNDSMHLLNQFTTGVNEVSSSAQLVAKASQDLAERSDQAKKVTEEGQRALKSILDLVNDSRDKSNLTAEIVEQLSIKAQSIGEIVNTINSIAEQTNLLALNAAIEAARAGEAGRGFAVVADEIRKLAEQSKLSTEKISQILGGIKQEAEKASNATKDMVTSVQHMSQESGTVLTSLNKMAQHVNEIASMADSLAASAQQQSASAEEMSAAVKSLEQSMNSILDKVEKVGESVTDQLKISDQISEASKHLVELSQILREHTNHFKI
uniref:Methyl-accepting chemotaxis protein n=1 Tax=Pseudothermotoga hypogea TaxID=57487 RepID=A0A832I7B5_9THEM